MYEFLYDYCFEKWGVDNVRTDTDSLILELSIEDLYKSILPDIPERFDTSKFKRTDFDGKYRKVLGKMKDKLAGELMTQFVGIGPKNYA